MTRIITIVVVAALVARAAHAEPLPLPKPPGPGGGCPHGYPSSGSGVLAQGLGRTVDRTSAQRSGSMQHAVVVLARSATIILHHQRRIAGDGTDASANNMAPQTA